MKSFARIASMLALVFAVAFALCGCTINVNITNPANSGSSASAVSQSSGGSGSSGAAASGNSADLSGSSGAAGASSASGTSGASGTSPSEAGSVTEDGQYSDKESVALYIHTYGHLPSNYISKSKARKAGWVSNKGNLWDVLPGMSIGGSEFHNDDGALPDAKGRRWTECDIDFEGGYRNAKRIVFSNDGLVFYTDDHYKTFEQLY